MRIYKTEADLSAFIGWMLPYFCYRGIVVKKTEQITKLIEQQYDAIYETCEKANALLYDATITVD